MKVITYKIPEESSELITEIVEKLGGTIERESRIKNQVKKTSRIEKNISNFFVWKMERFGY